MGCFLHIGNSQVVSIQAECSCYVSDVKLETDCCRVFQVLKPSGNLLHWALPLRPGTTGPRGCWCDCRYADDPC